MGFLNVLKSKVHGARVVESRLDYEGSLTLGKEIIEAAELFPGEKVLVSNLSNGKRFETYVIEGSEGAVYVNGAAAHLAQKGDILIVMSFKLVEEKEIKNHKPSLVYLDENNRIIKVSRELPREKTVYSC